MQHRVGLAGRRRQLALEPGELLGLSADAGCRDFRAGRDIQQRHQRQAALHDVQGLAAVDRQAVEQDALEPAFAGGQDDADPLVAGKPAIKAGPVGGHRGAGQIVLAPDPAGIRKTLFQAGAARHRDHAPDIGVVFQHPLGALEYQHIDVRRGPMGF